MTKEATVATTSKPINAEIIIEGNTREGKPFRPSDWVDRMCSTYATFGEDRKLKYSPYLKPKVVNGCLLYTSPSPRDGLLSRMPSSA